MSNKETPRDIRRGNEEYDRNGIRITLYDLEKPRMQSFIELLDYRGEEVAKYAQKHLDIMAEDSKYTHSSRKYEYRLIKAFLEFFARPVVEE